MTSAGDDRIHVAMVSPYPPPGVTDVGRGIAGYAKRLARALHARRVAVSVIAQRIGDVPADYVDEGIRVRRAWTGGATAVRDVLAAIRAVNPDLVHVQHELFLFGPRWAAGAPLALLALLRRPVMTTVHGVATPEDIVKTLAPAYAKGVPPMVVRLAYGGIIRSLCRRSDMVVAHNEALARAIRRYDRRATPVVIHHGIDAASSAPDRVAALRRLGWQDRPRALFLGYLLPYKGVDTLIAAAPSLARAGIEVVVAGATSGDDRPTHRARALDFSQVRRLGFVPEQSLADLLAATDVLVLPYRAGLAVSGPMALAASFGVPVVVSDVPSLSEDLACPEATFPAGDPEELASRVREVIGNPTVRRAIVGRLGAMSRARSWDVVAAATVEQYRRLLGIADPGRSRVDE